MPQNMIPASLPLYYQCLRVPVNWGLLGKAKSATATTSKRGRTAVIAAGPLKYELVDGFLSFGLEGGKPTLIDPWEKRDQFLRLKEDDTQGLLKFLNTVGLFQRAGPPSEFESTESVTVNTKDGLPHQVRYDVEIDARWIWIVRRSIERSLLTGENKIEGGDTADYQVRLTRHQGIPRVLLTTTTFLDALFLTISVDRILKAKVRKCARPDCGIVFSNSGGHDKKYCQRYCAHIESVRKDRQRKKQRAIESQER